MGCFKLGRRHTNANQDNLIGFAIKAPVKLKLGKLTNDIRQLLIRDPEASIVEEIIDDTLLDQLFENARTNLQAILLRQRRNLRIRLHLATVGLLEL